MSWVTVLKSAALGAIVLSAVSGNLLVIVSVLRHAKLRITTNYFLVSLAFADTLVALCAMSFSAIQIISGSWLFNQFLCKFYNSCDVLFSTASIMHICCISVDRYYAIIRPLEYPTKITGRTVAVMLACVWLSSGLISFIPIFLDWYTTEENLRRLEERPDICDFVANKPYAVISSSVSFWIPCFIMVFTYWKIYLEATRQEKLIYKAHVGVGLGSRASSTDYTAHMIVHSNRNSRVEDMESDPCTPTKRTISKMKREHKAAKTLGIIMGAFILCWLPFFLWYVSSSMCGEICKTPEIVVDILFWIGYFNSCINPIIYAYFNRDFREAFKETIQSVFCCCVRLSLIRDSHRTNHFNCTYRSTQDIGLVENKYVRDC